MFIFCVLCFNAMCQHSVIYDLSFYDLWPMIYHFMTYDLVFCFCCRNVLVSSTGISSPVIFYCLPVIFLAINQVAVQALELSTSKIGIKKLCDPHFENHFWALGFAQFPSKFSFESSQIFLRFDSRILERKKTKYGKINALRKPQNVVLR